MKVRRCGRQEDNAQPRPDDVEIYNYTVQPSTMSKSTLQSQLYKAPKVHNIIFVTMEYVDIVKLCYLYCVDLGKAQI